MGHVKKAVDFGDNQDRVQFTAGKNLGFFLYKKNRFSGFFYVFRF